jgi:hypothetical protein
MVTEVYKQARSVAGCFQVVEDLCSMFVCDLGDRLQFDDDLIETNQVGLVGLSQRLAFVGQLQFWLRDVGN